MIFPIVTHPSLPKDFPLNAGRRCSKNNPNLWFVRNKASQQMGCSSNGITASFISNSVLTLYRFIYAEQMDAEGLGRKLLLNPPRATPENP